MWAAVSGCGRVQAGIDRCGQLWAAVGRCGQVWAGVGSCGRVRAAVGGCGRVRAGVGRCGHMAVTWAAQVLGIGDADATSGSVAQAELRPTAAEPAGCAARPDSAPSGEGKASGGLRASLWPSWTIAPDTDSGLFPDHPQESGVTPDALV